MKTRFFSFLVILCFIFAAATQASFSKGKDNSKNASAGTVKTTNTVNMDSIKSSTAHKNTMHASTSKSMTHSKTNKSGTKTHSKMHSTTTKNKTTNKDTSNTKKTY